MESPDQGGSHTAAIITTATKIRDSPASVVCKWQPSLCGVALGLGASIGFDAEPDGVGIVV